MTQTVMALGWLAVGGVVVVLCLLGVIWHTAVEVVSLDGHAHGERAGAADPLERKDRHAPCDP